MPKTSGNLQSQYLSERLDMLPVCQLSHRAEGPVRAYASPKGERKLSESLASDEWTDCVAWQLELYTDENTIVTFVRVFVDSFRQFEVAGISSSNCVTAEMQ